jgi:hypothetical protein
LEPLMPTTRVLLVTGEQLEIEGDSSDVSRLLQDAARSSNGTLAWMTDLGTDGQVGVNPAQVVTVRPADS